MSSKQMPKCDYMLHTVDWVQTEWRTRRCSRPARYLFKLNGKMRNICIECRKQIEQPGLELITVFGEFPPPVKKIQFHPEVQIPDFQFVGFDAAASSDASVVGIFVHKPVEPKSLWFDELLGEQIKRNLYDEIRRSAGAQP